MRECVCWQGFEVVRGNFSHTFLHVGYHKIAEIPAGACNISIQETKKSRNYLGTNAFNGRINPGIAELYGDMWIWGFFFSLEDPRWHLHPKWKLGDWQARHLLCFGNTADLSATQWDPFTQWRVHHCTRAADWRPAPLCEMQTDTSLTSPSCVSQRVQMHILFFFCSWSTSSQVRVCATSTAHL